MNKLALFLAGIILGLFSGRFYHLMHAPAPWPTPQTVTAPDNDQDWEPCEYTTKLRPLYP